MATVNNRVKIPRATTINGIDAGGAMIARIMSGYDSRAKSSPDGSQIPMSDREVQFVRGSMVTQDWIHAIDLLTGTVGTLVFYEQKSGAATYIKHTITNPVIHKINLSFKKSDYAGCSFDFECRASDPDTVITDMWAHDDAQEAPTYIPAARGGYRISAAALGVISVHHVMDFDLTITCGLDKACNDGDLAYTAVDQRLDGLTVTGSIGFQSAAISGDSILAANLAIAARASLVLTITQASGADDKTLTVAGVEITDCGSDSSVDKSFSDFRASFEVTNNPTTMLTLAGANKILTIA